MKSPRRHHFITILPAILILTGPFPLPAADLVTATSSLFSGSGHCAFCHDQWGGALTDQAGNNLSITADWRGTMMAHSFKDSLWRAVMEAEVAENPSLQSYIEDKCQTCHAPMARTQHRKDSDQPLAHAQARKSDLAADGVSCTLCHQIQPDNLGRPESFTGHFTIHDTRKIFGPYREVFAMPMMHHVEYEPLFGQHVQDSALCATCHTLFTPTVDAAGQTTGEFPEQVPFLEWQASEFAQNSQHCQDCHMPRVDEPIQISARPPWIGTQQPFWRHSFVGGNAFMLQLIAAHPKQTQPNGETSDLETTVEKAREQLRRAARLTLTGERAGQTVTLEVRVQNLAGHKFPTGHPYRRAWLHLTLRTPQGKVLFESGRPDDRGRLSMITAPFAEHLDQITRPDQVQVYEAVMGDSQGRMTRSLLRAASYLKDNRLPPRGFSPPQDPSSPIAIRGTAAQDDNFNADRSGQDLVTYQVQVPEGTGEVEVTVELLYQSVPPEAVDRLMQARGEAARAFKRLYRRADLSPETVQQALLTL